MGNVTKVVEDISELDESFMKSSNEESDEGCFLEVNIEYLETLHNLYNDLAFLPERMKLVANLHDKTEHVIHIRN